MSGKKSKGERESKPQEQLGIIIETETTVTKEVSRASKKKKKIITTQKKEKRAIHFYRLQTIVSTDKFVEIVNEILRRERLLIK